MEYLKKELNSKDELITSLVDIQTAILETARKSKRNEDKRDLQVETSPILTPLQQENQENQSHHRNTIYVGNLDSNMSIEDIYERFGLKSTAYLRSNCHVDFPLNQQAQKTRGHVYITAPKHVCDELVKLNGVEFKGKFLIIENAKVRPKVTNPNLTNFTSPNRFEPLTYESNGPDLGNDIDHSEESDMCADLKRTVRNSQQTSKHNSKRRPPVVVNTHPENQTTFSKVPIFPGDKSYSEALTKKTEQENILIFSDSIPSRFKMYNFNKALKNGNAKHLSFPGTTSKQLLQYLDVNLKMYTPDTVLIHAGINDVLNNKSQSNTENLLSNIKYMVDKCRKFGVKNILISGLVFTTRVSLEVLEKIHEKLHAFCSSYGLTYIDNRNIRGVHLCQDNLHLLQSGKKILFNNFISYLNSNFLMYPHPSQTWT